MRSKSTTDYIFAIHQIMEKYYEYGQNVYMVFIDFKQAYDSVNSQQLWTAFEKF
jgi:sorting nexin-29